MQVMKPYSEDLRISIVNALQGGISKSAASRLFGVSLSSVKRYARIADPEEHRSRRGRVAEDPRRSTKPSRGCSKQTSGSVPQPPSLRGAASCGVQRARTSAFPP
jgi:transposase-like protein